MVNIPQHERTKLSPEAVKAAKVWQIMQQIKAASRVGDIELVFDLNMELDEALD